MDVQIGLTGVERANRFLRALWAEIRSNFSNYGWLYQPCKNGQAKRIFFGCLDLGISEGTLEISLLYKERGSIQTISFNLSSGQAIDHQSDLGQKLSQSTSNALKRADQPEKFLMRGSIENLHFPLSNYSDDNFKIEHLSKLDSALYIQVLAYDQDDAKSQFIHKLNHCLDVLAVETNVPFWISHNIKKQTAEDKRLQDFFVSDNDWIDDFPVLDSHLVISKEGKRLLALIAAGEETEEIQTFLAACRHFHTARKFDAQIHNKLSFGETQKIEKNQFSVSFRERDSRLADAYEMGSAHDEITTVMYMSALEVAANIGIAPIQSCEKCSQPMYRIRQRVADMASKYLPEKVVKNFIKDHYDNRSKYLHTGIMLTDQTYMGKSSPQLDTSSPSGCKVPHQVPVMNVREFTSYCLRKVWQALHENFQEV